jgi:hypothetical protein
MLEYVKDCEAKYTKRKELEYGECLLDSFKGWTPVSSGPTASVTVGREVRGKRTAAPSAGTCMLWEGEEIL